MKNKILDYLKQNPRTSFSEMSRDIPGFRGNVTVRLQDFRNLFVWVGVSQEAVDVLECMQREGQIHFDVRDRPYVESDPTRITLPIAKRLAHYKRPHWLPVTVVLSQLATERE